ncbi:phage holin family protein [Maribacter ulvicola]|uniref:Putative Holin-X, holin superfamily III n=1 Tax=Maribacter ulvicola TaxID=228959 RepID=A0A1N6QSJ3_9FLAO|nr:phage holin family protein [Maribacter ulvicola]SIQ19561.1 Putative Holin-X, holin superfamily III [Maribacter ulvicola]
MDYKIMMEELRKKIFKNFDEIEKSFIEKGKEEYEKVRAFLLLTKQLVLYNIDLFVNESQAYIHKQLATLESKLTQQIAAILSSIVKVFLLLVFGSFVLFFISVSGAILLGDVLSNTALGFLIIAGVYLVLGIIIYKISKDKIQAFFNNIIIDRLHGRNN